MNNIFSKQKNANIYIFIFFFVIFFFNIHNIYAAVTKPPVTTLSKKYTKATWSKDCINKGGECIANGLFKSQESELKKITGVDCGSKKNEYTCVDRKVGDKFLCTRCSNNKGCQRVSFYTANDPTLNNGKSGEVNECSSEPTSSDAKVTYAPDSTCPAASIVPGDASMNNDGCKCESLSGECVDKCSAGTSSVQNASGCASGKVCCAKTAQEKAKTTCSSPNICTSGTGAVCPNNVAPVNATCGTGQICCPQAKTTGTCISPNQCMSPYSGAMNAANQSCMLNGQTFQISYCNSRRSQVQGGITGCMIANQFIPASCDLITYPNGNASYGTNSQCQNGGSVVNLTCPTAGQICCSQASVMQSLANSLTSGLSSLMNKLFNQTGSTSTNPTVPTPYYTPTPSPTPILGSLNNPNGVDVTFNLKIKFQGIVNPKSELNKLKVKVAIVDAQATSGTKSAAQDVDFTAGSATIASGSAAIWTGSVTFTKVEPKQGYQLLIKGPKHVQKKICANSPTESYPGEYFCDDLLNVVAGNNDLDLSNIYMMTGDVPKQDGVVNSVDLSAVRTRFGKLDYTSIDTADLNLDGAVNSQDFSVILQTLQKTDGIDQK